MGFLKKSKGYREALIKALRNMEDEISLHNIADCAINLIDSIGLIDQKGDEIGIRKSVIFMKTGKPGEIISSEDILFDIPAGAEVCGWRAYSGDYWVEGVLSPETYTEEGGEYLLCGAKTTVKHYL